MSPSSTAVVVPAAIRGRRLRRTPGELVIEGGLVRFRTMGAVVFRAPLTEVDAVAWPWWWFGSRLVITVRGERYRIVFGQPGEQFGSDPNPSCTADSDADLIFSIMIGLLQILVSIAGRSTERAAVRQLREVLRPTARLRDEGPFRIAASQQGA